MLTRANIVQRLRLDLVSPSLLAGLLVLSLGFNVVMALRVRSVITRSERTKTLNIGDFVPFGTTRGPGGEAHTPSVRHRARHNTILL